MIARKMESVMSLVQYIENNLSEKITAEDLTKEAFVSKSQLYRDFFSIVGYPVIEYIRKRRLSNALALLKVTDGSFSLADIA